MYSWCSPLFTNKNLRYHCSDVGSSVGERVSSLYRISPLAVPVAAKRRGPGNGGSVAGLKTWRCPKRKVNFDGFWMVL